MALPLDDAAWKSLSHAYHAAHDTTKLLQELATKTWPAAGDDETWTTLWSSLCHQGDVYTASYAAVPHIVDIACNAKGPIDFSFFLLPAAIEIARSQGRGPEVPVELTESYHSAITRLVDAVAAHVDEPWDVHMTRAALAAQAVAKGHIKLAEALMNLDEYLIERVIALDF